MNSIYDGRYMGDIVILFNTITERDSLDCVKEDINFRES